MDALLSMLLQKSYRQGKVKLASGKTSDFFIDCKQTILTARGHVLVAEALWPVIQEHAAGAKAVAGVAVGGCSLASAVSMFSVTQGKDLDAVYVRKDAKDHGTAKRIEGDAGLVSGDEIVIVEDVVTTGGSTLSAVGALRQAGYLVRSTICLVDRDEGGKERLAEANINLWSLYRRNDFVSSA